MNIKPPILLSVLLILTGCASTKEQANTSIQEQLHTSIIEKDVSTAKALIADGADPYARNEDGKSPISEALKAPTGSRLSYWASERVKESSAKAKMLLERISEDHISVEKIESILQNESFYLDAPINENGESLILGLLPISGDAPYTKREIGRVVELLLEEGADPDIAQKSGGVALMQAVYEGNSKAVDALIRAGADLNAKSSNGTTALHFTANKPDKGDREHDEKLARRLIKAGANVNARKDNNQTPLYMAIANERTKIREILLDAGADPDIAREDGWTPLIEAIYNGNRPAVEALIDAGADVSAQVQGKNRWTALHYTANNPDNGNREHDEEFARKLIEAGAKLDWQTTHSMTPLFLSIANERTKIREILLDAGADLDTAAEDGKTALMEAVLLADRQAVDSLIDAGADLNAKDNRGRTALHLATNNFATNRPSNGEHDKEIARHLIKAGADVNARTNEGHTPLNRAIRFERAEIRNLLLQSRADPDIAGEDGETPLMVAVTGRDLQAVDALIDAGADLNARMIHGDTALHCTTNQFGIRDHRGVIARKLVESGAFVDPVDYKLNTPLIEAAMHGWIGVAEILLENGAHIDYENSSGRNAEQAALKAGNYEIVKLIREHEE